MVFLSRVVYQAVLRRIEPARLVARQVVILHCFKKRQACRKRYLQANLAAPRRCSGDPAIRRSGDPAAAAPVFAQITSAASAAGER
jgi:hypothetical protein